MPMLTRRSALLAPLAGAMIPAAHAGGAKMTLCIHQTSSRPAGYRKIIEGWSKAGIKHAELTDAVLDDFLKTGTLADAKKILSDNGMTPVSGAAVLQDLWLPGPARANSLETWKKRCDQFSTLGLTRIYCPSTTNRMIKEDDYKATPAALRETGDVAKAHGLTSMIEFTRTSTHLSTLTTSLKMIREAAHPNVRPMLDFYHFWSGMSKFEDLDLLHPGELAHAHFQDTPDMPRELLGQQTRVLPGDGVAPMVAILKKLADKGYSGSLSVELFLPEFTQADPYELGKRVKEKGEAVMKKAKVL